MMPGPAPAIVEAEYCSRMGAWHKVFDDYVAANCNKKGEQIETNLSANEALGLKMIGKKIAKNEIVVLEADKGEMLCHGVGADIHIDGS